MITRNHDWDVVLAREIDLARNRSFTWGSFDCATWACDVIREMTGTDLAADFRGKYESRAEARAIINQYGSLEDLVRAVGGLPEINPTMACRGDLVLVTQTGGRKALGLVGTDARYAVCTGATGVVFVPMNQATHVWRV